MLPNATQLAAAVQCSAAVAQRWVGPMREACRVYEIDTGKRLAAFFAQVGHESSGLTAVVENLNYSAAGLKATWPTRFTDAQAQAMARKPEAIANHVYGNRMGNKHPGDGWAYRGRGAIQLTGRANYAAMRDTILDRLNSCPDFELHPEIVESPQWAAMTAGAFWDDHDLNTLADRSEFAAITKRINGGSHGMADRRARYAKALRVFAS